MMQLNNTYDRNDFLKFLEDNFLTDFKKDIRPASTQGFSSIQKAYSLGRSESLDLQVFEFSFEGSPNKRVTLTKDAFQVMRSSAIFRALAIFHSPNSDDWRLSLMTATPERTEKGKVALSYSNPKRLSFFLGPNAKVNTPTKFILKKDKITNFEDLKSRFSIEVVNKEFYKEISEYFTQLVGGSLYKGKKKEDYKALLKLPFVQDKSQTSLEFAVRLIGRVIFGWFLREKKSDQGKSLMPNDLLSLEAVKKIPDYYHKILEPIFFEVLNKPIKSRREEFAKEPFSSIPYLNGGLFSPHEDDYYKRTNGDFQSQFHNTLVIPDDWLIKFFEVLETYNFTIDENTSFDEELSIDPEMLGRIFENLLAEINPETGESARKSTGSYYTPRVIVDYMVDESLFLYLKNQTQIDEKKLRAVISYDLNDDEEIPLRENEKESIVDALEKVKLLDPACGSGAFPMGALQKIVFILQQADPEGQLWFKKQIKNTSPEIKKVIEREFAHKNFDYIRKLGIIRENIYGVDIQPIATEISRLRCFLTIVVDERIQEDLDNRGIEPLPNLDFKFVTANTLIGLPGSQGINQMGLFEDDAGIRELKELRDLFFNAYGTGRDQLKLQFVQAQNRMFQRLISEGRRGHADLTTKLTTWDPFSHKSASWFDPEWMFGIKNGFDVVIANPPYIDSEGMVKNKLESLREYIVENYRYTKGNWDIYIAFFEKGFGNLKDNGVLTFISPDKWISKPFGNELRKNKYQSLFSILNAGRHIFESAKVDSIVSIFFNQKQVSNLRVFKILNGTVSFIRDYDKSKLKPPFTLDCVFSKHLKLIDKIDKYSSNTTLNCENACATSDAYKLSPLIEDLTDSYYPDTDLKIINTGTIGKWSSKWGLKDMTYLGKKYSRPIVSKKHFFDEFKNSYSSKSIKSKLILKGLNLLDVCLDLRGEFIPGKSTLIISGFNERRLKYLMAYLNTPLPIFYLKEKYPASSYNQGTTFTKDMINNLPIPQIPSLDEDQIIQNVDALIKLTESEDYLQNSTKQKQIKEYEKQIDQVVYKLYELTPEEIAIVEGRKNEQ
jgi:hypothetical protein